MKFSYNIKLGAIPETNSTGADFGMPVAAPVAIQDVSTMKSGVHMAGNANGGFLYNSTDFWGFYTLVKK